MLESFNTGMKNIASSYARLLAVKVTATSIKTDVEENPFYPSLLSLSETFARYHINNTAFHLEPETAIKLQPPFVAYVTVPEIGKDFVLVTKITAGTVTYTHRSNRSKTASQKDFLDRYQKIVWVAEPDESSGEPEFEQKRKLEKAGKNRYIAWICTGAVLVLLAVIINALSVPSPLAFVSIAAIKFVGLSATVLLLTYENDKNNLLVKDICGAGARTGCDAVLGSKAAQILGISWAEIGFFYFASTSLLLLSPEISFADKVFLLASANGLTIPYIMFSLYYQWKVLKQWCPICLTIQAVLLSELTWAVINDWASASPFSFPTGSFLPVILPMMGICLLTPIVGWYGIQPLISRSRDAGEYAAAFKRLQYNPEIFRSLLAQQEKAPEGWQDLGIDVGDPNAENTIIKVCSPYCGACAKAHPVLEEIVRRNNKVRLKIIFTAKNETKNEKAKVVRHLMAIAAEGDQAKTQQALDDWYLADKKNYAVFAGKYDMNGALEQQGSKLDAMSNWCTEAEIIYTPTIFLNGFRLPANYQIGELRNLL